MQKPPSPSPSSKVPQLTSIDAEPKGASRGILFNLRLLSNKSLLFKSVLALLSKSKSSQSSRSVRAHHPTNRRDIDPLQPLPPIFEKDPYQPLPPPAYPVLENRHAMTNVVKPHDEKKLYPPVIPGCSTLSLHRRSPNNIFVASPYNTLRATSVGRYQSGFLDTNSIMENRFGSRQASVASRRQSSEASSQKRSKSMGPLHRTGSNRSKGSGRSRRRENSQI
ncbi:hypothetical protein GCK72_014750 [Caenorhabditis remanei]|uniref:Uncharacterized protein n=1 Tax=Caenorhabditis remanei TaxID=31234 RepID=A0A6A5GVA2_CAERE|nr:hypothetical protein GCK72_014750 [Caenorhabditis remanei]KAF1758292.1 hypothetical protein GCK72_014750 [Caenorhabditis remanei]